VTPPEERGQDAMCKECDAHVEYCAFCEREDCSELICYRCLRQALGQSLSHPLLYGR
jgi:hypothetical protein